MAGLKFLFFVILCTQTVFAADETVLMQTVSPNAEAYAKPSFSSKVVTRLKLQTVLNVNPKKFVSSDGIGVFYEAKTPDGRTVYLADSVLGAARKGATATVVAKREAPAPVVQAPAPVKPVAPAPVAVAKPAAPVAPAPPVAVAPPPQRVIPAPVAPAPPAVSAAVAKELDAMSDDTVQTMNRRARAEAANESIYGSRTSYVGINLGMVNYAEKYKETVYQAPRAAVGLKYSSTFSSRWLGSEANLIFSPGAPKFLIDAGAAGSSGGYYALGDYQLVARGRLSSNFEVKAGAGVAVINSKFNTIMITDPYTSESTRAGAVINAGFAYTRPSWGMIFDLRQTLENQSYFGSQVAFLFPL